MEVIIFKLNQKNSSLVSRNQPGEKKNLSLTHPRCRQYIRRYTFCFKKTPKKHKHIHKQKAKETKEAS